MSTLYEQRKAARLCYRCATPLAPDEKGIRCSLCAERMRAYQQRRRSRRISTALCLDCGLPTGSNRRKCAQCRQRDVGYARSKSEHWAKQGLCADCGKAPPLESTACANRYPRCEACYFRRAAKDRLGSSKVWKNLREKLIAQDYRCPYTGEQLVLGVNDSVDHKYPVARFPERAHDPNNIEWVSRPINEMKRDRTPEEFMSLIAHILSYRQKNGAGSAFGDSRGCLRE
jgi:hypothetical protein